MGRLPLGAGRLRIFRQRCEAEIRPYDAWLLLPHDGEPAGYKVVDNLRIRGLLQARAFNAVKWMWSSLLTPMPEDELERHMEVLGIRESLTETQGYELVDVGAERTELTRAA